MKDLITHIELHSVEGIEASFNAGISPNDLFNGQPLIYELISEYTRGPRFSECVRAFIRHGLVFDDKVLLAVLSNDTEMLSRELDKSPNAINKKYSLRAAYTPLEQVSLMHICAEFNLVDCATILHNKGCPIDERAGVDSIGFGGQTPLFHTVNQNQNQSAAMLSFLLDNGASAETSVRGFIWGRSYPWETLIPSVNPISYAMMGLLPQMHRDEATISSIVTRLLTHAYQIDYTPANIPNEYLR